MLDFPNLYMLYLLSKEDQQTISEKSKSTQLAADCIDGK